MMYHFILCPMHVLGQIGGWQIIFCQNRGSLNQSKWGFPNQIRKKKSLEQFFFVDLRPDGCCASNIDEV